MKYLAPPPWTVDENCTVWRNSLSIRDAEGSHVAHLTRGYEADANGDDCPPWTNARLIAAAPDLLAALKVALERIPNEHDFDHTPSDDAARVQARAAILKATSGAHE